MKKNIAIAMLLPLGFLASGVQAYDLTENQKATVLNIESKIDSMVVNKKFTYDEIYSKLSNMISKTSSPNALAMYLAEKLSLKIDRTSTFMPVGGYHATVKGTNYVEPSNTTKLNVGEKIKNLTTKSFTFSPTVQRMTDKTYWVQLGFYNAMFYVGDKEVLVFDTLAWGGGEKIIKEIRKVTDKPITTLVYSHQHEDHIGDVQSFIDEAKKDGYDLKIVSSDKTYDVMKEHSKLPIANIVLKYSGDSFNFENETITLKGFTNPAHEVDSAMWILKNEKVMHIPDYVNPDQMAYLSFGASQTYRNFKNNLEEMYAMDFNFYSGGHGNIGGKVDVKFMLDYLSDLETAIKDAQTNINAMAYFVPSYNNHQASALAGENAIVDYVMKKLRPKYGNFYGFEASVPHQIRFVMLTSH